MGRKSGFIKKRAPPPTIRQSRTGGTIGESIKSGFGLGLGLEGARAVIGGAIGMVSGGNKQTNETTAVITNKQPEACNIEKKMLEKCLDNNNSETFSCREFIDLLSDCNKIALNNK